MLTSFACNGLFAVRDSAGMTGAKIAVISSAPFSHGISGRERVGKFKSMLSEVSVVGNALVGPTEFSSKTTSRRI